MTAGIHSMAFEQYSAAEGINVSALKLILPTPARFKAYMDLPRPEPTEAQRMGVLTHRIILEPDTMDGAIYVKPEGMNFATVDGKAWKKEHSDRPIISTPEFEQIKGMRDAVWRHPTAKRLLTGGVFEQCLFAEDEHGTLRKARLDALIKGNIIPDLKICQSAHPDSFAYSIRDYCYHEAAAYYIDICELVDVHKQVFQFIAVEKTPPYLVAVHTLTPEAEAIGRAMYQAKLQVYRTCMERNEWPGIEDSDVSLPDYDMKKAIAEKLI